MLWEDMVFSEFRSRVSASKHYPISILLQVILFAIVDIQLISSKKDELKIIRKEHKKKLVEGAD